MDTTAELGTFSAEELKIMLWAGPPVGLLWDQIEPLLLQEPDRFYEYFTPEYVKQKLMAGQFVLWTAADDGGIFLTMLIEVVDFPNKTLVRVLYISGKGLMRVIRAGGLDMLHLWARKHGASEVVAAGRVGFIRLLERYGYYVTAFEVSRRLDDVKEH